MKLTFRPFQLHLAQPWTIARTLMPGGNPESSRTVIFLELKDEQGLIGRGETSPSKRYDETPETVLSFLAQVDPAQLSFRDIEVSMEYLQSLSPGALAAKCALNIALLDGAAKLAGKTVCESLGLNFAEGKHFTSYSIGLADPQAIREKVLTAEPYPILKLKVGGPHDRENLAALRDVAPEKTVRVDANEGWKTKEEALRQIEWLAGDPNIEFVEQPMPATTDGKDWVWLSERSPLPMMADESYRFETDLEQCAQWARLVNVKLVKTGGITGAVRALTAARAVGLKTMIGCMIESSLLITAAAHLAALADHLDLDGNLLINNDPYEGVSCDCGLLSFTPAPPGSGLRVRPKVAA